MNNCITCNKETRRPIIIYYENYCRKCAIKELNKTYNLNIKEEEEENDRL